VAFLKQATYFQKRFGFDFRFSLTCFNRLSLSDLIATLTNYKRKNI
jgi:hypothetical protein